MSFVSASFALSVKGLICCQRGKRRGKLGAALEKNWFGRTCEQGLANVTSDQGCFELVKNGLRDRTGDSPGDSGVGRSLDENQDG